MIVQQPEHGRHAAAIHRLFSESFGEFVRWHDYATAGYFEGAPYDWEASRIGLVDGELASHFGVWDFTMRIGACHVRVACIGAVATSGALRAGGLMRQLATESVSGLRSAGYDMSLLFGIQRFYTRFGYVSSFADGRFVIQTRELKPAGPPTAFERYDGDVVALADQYNSENAGVTGTFVRPTYTTNREPARFSVSVFDGGYVIAGREGHTLQVEDCAGPPQQILDVCRQRALQAVAPEIDFVFLPRRSRLGEYLHTISHKYVSEFAADGGPMARVTNLKSLMTKIAPELSNRLQAGARATYTGALDFHGDDESVRVTVKDGAVDRVDEIPHVNGGQRGSEAPVDDAGSTPGSGTVAAGAVVAGPGLIRLILGDNDPWRICAQQNIAVSGDARHLIPVLFPNQEPSTILWDRF